MHVISRRRNQQIVIQVGSETVIVRVLQSQFNKCSLGIMASGSNVVALSEEKARHSGLEQDIARLLDDESEKEAFTSEEPFCHSLCNVH